MVTCAFMVLSLYTEYRRKERNERNNVLRREYIEKLENSPKGELSEKQFSHTMTT